jgi:WD40 repeat protein
MPLHQGPVEVNLDPAKLFTSQEISPSPNTAPPNTANMTSSSSSIPATPERNTLRTSTSLTSSAKKVKSELGMPIASKSFQYTRFTLPRKPLEVVPITLFPKPEANVYKCGNIISVNAKFMCYVVKGNSVRVIEIMTAARQLLKGHEANIVDMKFFSDTEDVLATLDKDGRLVVWNLESHATGATNDIRATRQLEHTFTAAGPFVALAWDPSTKDNLAVVGQGALWLCNIPLCMSSSNAQDGVLKLPVPEGDDSVVYNDLSFSHDGRHIAAAGSNGTVVVWSMATREVVKVLQPHEGSPVYAAKFLAPEKSVAPGVEKLFLTGNKLNEELKLWHSDTWELLQTITLNVNLEQDASHGFGNKLCFDKTCSFLFVTHTHVQCLDILHLEPPVPIKSGDQIVDFDVTHTKFDYLTEFSLENKKDELNPIMSFTVTNHKPQDHHHPHQQGNAPTAQTTDGEHDEVLHLQVYATQLRSIQMYHLNSSRCYVPQERAVSAPISEQPVNERPAEVVHENNNTNQRAVSPPTVTDLPAVQPPQPVVPQQPPHSEDKSHATTPIMYVPHEQHATSKPVEEEPSVPASPPHSGEKSEEEVSEPQEPEVAQDMFEMEEPEEIDTTPLPEQKLLAAPIGAGDATAASKKTPSKGGKQKVQFAPGTKDKDSTGKVKQPRAKKDKLGADSAVTILKKEDEPAPYVYEEVNTPESELIKRVKESGSGDLLQAIEEVIKFQNQQLFKRLDEERKQRERAEQERQKALLSNISHALNQNLPKLLEKALNKQFKTLTASMNKVVGQLIEANLLKQLQEGLKKLFFQNFVPRIETSVKEAIDKHLASKQIVQHVSEAVEKGVRQPIMDTFRSQFSEVLAPSFELALQKLFEQINNTFESGIREYQATLQVSLSDVKPLSTPSSTANNTNLPSRTVSHSSDASVVTTELLRVAVNSLVAVAENMNRVIVDTQSKILNEYMERNGGSINNNNAVPSIALDSEAAINAASSKLSVAGAAKKKVAATSSNKELKVELEKSLKNELYEDAFTKALRANDLEIVAWLCSRVAPQKIFGKSPLPLSQVVLISLVQQLSCDLNKATSMKLNWLKDILLVLDPMDQTISEHVTTILTTLSTALDELASTCGDVANPCFNAYRLLVHIVNSHLGHSIKTPQSSNVNFE